MRELKKLKHISEGNSLNIQTILQGKVLKKTRGLLEDSGNEKKEYFILMTKTR